MLRQRIVTGTLLFIVAIAAVFFGGYLLRAFVLFFYVAGAYEFWRMRQEISHQEALWRSGMLLSLPLSAWLWNARGLFYVVPLITMFFLAAEVVRTERTQHAGFPLESLCHSLLGLTYVGFLGTSLCLVASSYPRAILCWFLLLVIAADTAAFIGGRAIGGKKLAPRISPGKTVSGALVGIVSAAVVSVWARYWLALSTDWSATSILFGIASGIFVAVLAIFGDLTESLIKRINEVKDSGNILPGHGGVLDRIDGYLFASPALFLIGGI